MSTNNEALNDMWEKYHAEKKVLGGGSRTVTDHNEYTSTASKQHTGMTIHMIQMVGDSNPSFVQQLKQHGQLVQMMELFSSESPVKAPMVGAGYSAATVLSKEMLMSSGTTPTGKGTSERPLLLTVFQSWPQVKGLLWEFIVQRYQVADFPFISSMFVAEFERTITTVIDRHRTFVWEELEIVMYQMLEQLIVQIEERLAFILTHGQAGVD
jgi:hypothetical protein